MHISIKTILLASFLVALFNIQQVFSQPPGRPPGGMDMSDMVSREKQTLYKNISDLSEDQKLLLDGIYDEFALTMKQNMEEMRNNRGSMDRESMRAKMDALREEKDSLIRDVLDSDQYAIYLDQMESAFGARRRRREQMNPADTTVSEQ